DCLRFVHDIELRHAIVFMGFSFRDWWNTHHIIELETAEQRYCNQIRMVSFDWWPGFFDGLLYHYIRWIRKCGKLAHSCTVHHFKRHEWNVGFSRRVACVEDEKYVLRHELEQTKGNLHKRINQVDSKHDSKHSDLKLLLHTFMESQKPLGKSLQNIEGEMKTLNTTMSGYNKRITDIDRKSTR